MTCYKRQNQGDSKRSVAASGWGGEGGINGRDRAKDFQGCETILYDITEVDTHHYIYVKTHKLYNTKSEL